MKQIKAQDITCTWVSPEGKSNTFKTDNRLVEFHTRMLTNNPFVKSFSFGKVSNATTA